MADMNKLMEFLQKEVPSNAGDLNDAINNILDIIDRTHAALGANVGRLYQYKKYSEIREYENAGEQLSDIEDYLRQLVNNSSSLICQEQQDNTVDNNLTTSKPNYDLCKVDDTKPYSLDADFSKKRPIAFTFEGKRYDVQSWKRFIVMVCELLNDKNSKLFQSFPEDNSMQGRTRKYFIRQSSPYHKKVARTGIWVLTNNDGSANCRIIIKMFEKYDIPITSMEIFIQSDYSLRDEENDDIDIDENVKKN